MATLAISPQLGSFGLSFLMHGVLLLLGGLAFVKPVEYAVEAGQGGVEIYLTAAPMEQVSTEPQPIEESLLPLPQEIVKHAPEEIIEPIQTPTPPVEKRLSTLQPQLQSTEPLLHKGDGSSLNPGKDAITFRSSEGAIVEVKPHYLKNPAPTYPWQARKNKWEGVVMLKVIVDKSGHPAQIEIEKSSGYEVLDESASNTLKRWRFRPAYVGSLPIQSLVRVPIRFELER